MCESELSTSFSYRLRIALPPAPEARLATTTLEPCKLVVAGLHRSAAPPFAVEADREAAGACFSQQTTMSSGWCRRQQNSSNSSPQHSWMSCTKAKAA